MAQEISSPVTGPLRSHEGGSPTLVAPALLGPERQNLCPSSLSPNSPHPHFSRSSRPRRWLEKQNRDPLQNSCIRIYIQCAL